MLVGYAGYYLCRSHFSVAKPFLIEAYPGMVTKESLGVVASVGTLLYAAGKFVNGALADRFTGRAMFLLGMIGAILATVALAAGGPPLFLLAWGANRLVQSAGWVGMVRIVGNWFGSGWYGGNVYGRVMAFVSLSYLFGDFLSRKFIAALFGQGLTWTQVFYVCAGVLSVIAVATWVGLREGPTSAPATTSALAPEPTAPPITARDLFAQPTFWLVCVLSFVFTFLRETFNEWSPTYLNEAGGMSKVAAGDASALFPLFGGLSVIACGFLKDRGPGNAPRILLYGLLLGTITLFGLANLPDGASGQHLPLVALTAFVLIGPYSLLAGAISLDFGGASRSATAAGWIDGVGYIGGILSGSLIASVATRQGWGNAMQILAVLCVVSAALAWWYLLQQRATKPIP